MPTGRPPAPEPIGAPGSQTLARGLSALQLGRRIARRA